MSSDKERWHFRARDEQFSTLTKQTLKCHCEIINQENRKNHITTEEHSGGAI